MIGRRCLTCVVATGAVAALSVLWAGDASAELQRTVNGPSSVTPGETYTFDVFGFVPGERIYATVRPVACARRSERCEQAACPACSPARIGQDGGATVRFRWPATSLRAIANMD